jgi:hypothetical protein
VWQVLGSIGRFDRFLSSLGADDPRTWAAVTQEHVIRCLDEARNYALEDAQPFFAWLSWRKSVEPVVIPSHGGGLQRLRPLPRRLIRELFVHWTAPDADPQWALPALLSFVHAVPRAGFASCGSRMSFSTMASWAFGVCLSSPNLSTMRWLTSWSGEQLTTLVRQLTCW